MIASCLCCSPASSAPSLVRLTVTHCSSPVDSDDQIACPGTSTRRCHRNHVAVVGGAERADRGCPARSASSLDSSPSLGADSRTGRRPIIRSVWSICSHTSYECNPSSVPACASNGHTRASKTASFRNGKSRARVVSVARTRVAYGADGSIITLAGVATAIQLRRTSNRERSSMARTSAQSTAWGNTGSAGV
jgi:hypothetical protein